MHPWPRTPREGVTQADRPALYEVGGRLCVACHGTSRRIVAWSVGPV